MPRYGEHGDPTPRCAYCGKPEIKVMWSGPRRQYCSHKCMAAGEYHVTLFCGICVVPITVLMTIGFMLALITNPYTIDGTYVLLVSIFDFFGVFTIFTVYRGWKESN